MTTSISSEALKTWIDKLKKMNQTNVMYLVIKEKQKSFALLQCNAFMK